MKYFVKIQIFLVCFSLIYFYKIIFIQGEFDEIFLKLYINNVYYITSIKILFLLVFYAFINSYLFYIFIKVKKINHTNHFYIFVKNGLINFLLPHAGSITRAIESKKKLT